jgi:hypothetical protein
MTAKIFTSPSTNTAISSNLAYAYLAVDEDHEVESEYQLNIRVSRLMWGCDHWPSNPKQTSSLLHKDSHIRLHKIKLLAIALVTVYFQPWYLCAVRSRSSCRTHIYMPRAEVFTAPLAVPCAYHKTRRSLPLSRSLKTRT